jgi:hypothetical protein
LPKGVDHRLSVALPRLALKAPGLTPITRLKSAVDWVNIGKVCSISGVWAAMTEDMRRYRAGFSRVIGLARRL